MPCWVPSHLASTDTDARLTKVCVNKHSLTFTKLYLTEEVSYSQILLLLFPTYELPIYSSAFAHDPAPTGGHPPSGHHQSPQLSLPETASFPKYGPSACPSQVPMLATTPAPCPELPTTLRASICKASSWIPLALPPICWFGPAVLRLLFVFLAEQCITETAGQPSIALFIYLIPVYFWMCSFL